MMNPGTVTQWDRRSGQHVKKLIQITKLQRTICLIFNNELHVHVSRHNKKLKKTWQTVWMQMRAESMWGVSDENTGHLLRGQYDEEVSDVTCGQVWLPILGICALQLTHPKCTNTAVNTHTPGAVGSHLCCGAQGAVGGSVSCSRVSPQSWYWGWRERCTFTPPTYNSCRYRDSNPRHLGYESDSLGHEFPFFLFFFFSFLEVKAAVRFLINSSDRARHVQSKVNAVSEREQYLILLPFIWTKTLFTQGFSCI